MHSSVVLANTLYATMNERRPWIVSGGLQVDRTETLCGRAVRQPWIHTHQSTSIGAERGQTIVVKDESCNLHDLGPVLREFIRCVPTAIQTVC